MRFERVEMNDREVPFSRAFQIVRDRLTRTRWKYREIWILNECTWYGKSRKRRHHCARDTENKDISQLWVVSIPYQSCLWPIMLISISIFIQRRIIKSLLTQSMWCIGSRKLSIGIRVWPYQKRCQISQAEQSFVKIVTSSCSKSMLCYFFSTVLFFCPFDRLLTGFVRCVRCVVCLVSSLEGVCWESCRKAVENLPFVLLIR